jgi:phytoene/squalene synthetase
MRSPHLSRHSLRQFSQSFSLLSSSFHPLSPSLFSPCLSLSQDSSLSSHSFSRSLSTTTTTPSSSSSSSSSSILKEKDYCFNLVKSHDFENYLIGLLLSHSHRSHFFAIHSFNIEMALIKNSTKENKNAARIRFKWWNEVIAAISEERFESTIYQHPVAQELATTMKERKLSRRWFENVIEARLQDILSPQPETLSDLEDMVEKSHSSLLYLTLEALQLKEKYPEQIDHMASHIGVAYGIVSVLRGTAYDLSRGQLRLPSETLINKGLPSTFSRDLSNTLFESSKANITKEDDKKFREVVFDTAAQAYGHLDRAR